MKKQALRTTAFLSVVALLMAAAVGCGEKETTSRNADSGAVSSEYITSETSSEQQTESGDASSASSTNASSTGGSHSATGTASTGGTASAGKNNAGTAANTSSAAATTDLSKLKGTTVRFPFWKNVGGEINQSAINKFQNKYSIKVKMELVPQDQYITNIAGKIAAGTAPDLYWSNDDFPACLGDLQPLTAGNINFSDSLWDTNIIKAATINNKTYLINAKGQSTPSLVYYNKKLFQNNNLKTPEEYVAEGNWTWETMTRVMRSVKSLGSNYVGAYIDCEGFWAGYGVSFYRYSNGKFTSGLDANMTRCMTQLSTWLDDGLMRGIGLDYRDEFAKGNVGLALDGTFGLKTYGYWGKMDPSHVGFVPLPDIDKNTKATNGTSLAGWGICKGASNPVGAGAFIRYYADLSNHDLSKDYISKEAQTFAMKLSSTSNVFKPLMTGCSHTLGQDRFTYWKLVQNKPEQIKQTLESMANQVNEGVNRLNARMEAIANGK